MNYWYCETATNKAGLHKWRYYGKARQLYVCEACHVHVSKAQLKTNTDGGVPGDPIAEEMPA